MNENLLLALEISALGMGLVFLAIILLWLLMWAMTAIPFKSSAELDSEHIAPNALPLPASDDDLRAKAAAIAVAIALAEQSQSSAHPLSQPPTAIISAWQLGMRTRQMYEKGGR